MEGNSKSKPKENSIELIASSEAYFSEVVRSALSARKIQTYPQVEIYLVQLLEHYLDSRNLFEPEDAGDQASGRKLQTLAEMLLVAQNQGEPKRSELLKKLGDRALYISGFFGESLQKKLVDVDYYVEMGGNAYRVLARSGRDDLVSNIYWTISSRFIDFVDAFAYISQNSLIKSNESILRLYDRYLNTGSELAKEKLLEMGVLPVSPNNSNKRKVVG
jgi:hypothetical protein